MTAVKVSPRSTSAPPTSLIVIGASAGGPSALAAVLGVLPPTFSSSIVIVQHVDARFVADMRYWLAQHTSLPVRIAQTGDRPQAGTVLLAGGDQHLALGRTGALQYVNARTPSTYCPSIDHFFESVAAWWQGSAIGVVLTGMGRDGAVGLRALRDAGAVTIAQDRESSVVYGMPQAAAELDAAHEVLALSAIGERLIQLASRPLAPLRRNPR